MSKVLWGVPHHKAPDYKSVGQVTSPAAIWGHWAGFIFFYVFGVGVKVRGEMKWDIEKPLGPVPLYFFFHRS